MTDTPAPQFGIMKLGDEFVALSPIPLNVIYSSQSSFFEALSPSLSLANLGKHAEGGSRSNPKSSLLRQPGDPTPPTQLGLLGGLAHLFQKDDDKSGK